MLLFFYRCFWVGTTAWLKISLEPLKLSEYFVQIILPAQEGVRRDVIDHIEMFCNWKRRQLIFGIPQPG